MKLLLVVDALLIETPDGKVWSSKIYNYDFFKRYLSVFDKVKIITRIEKKDNNDGYPNLCSGDNTEFFSVLKFKGNIDYIKKYRLLIKEAKNTFNDYDTAIFRIPSILGYLYLKEFRKTKKPYALEVVVDPWDFAAPKMLKTKARPVIRILWTLKLKYACKKANGVSYVTKYALQKRYPCKALKHTSNNYFTSYYSSANISNSFFGKPRTYNKNYNNIKIVHIANNIGNYVKGHKELIESLVVLKKYDIFPNVTFVGDGEYIDIFKQLSKKLNVEKQVNFIGKLSNETEIKKILQKNDIFVFPSHAEGLPRVLIEAMANGLPCISSNINGIPELLENDFLIKAGDVNDLANKIQRFVKNPSLMTESSKKNIDIAKNYSNIILQKRREEFYKKLKEITK